MRWWLPILACACGRIGFGVDSDPPLTDGGPPVIDTPGSNDAPDASGARACLVKADYVVTAGTQSRYRHVATLRSWADAQADCAGDDAHLTILDDAAEIANVDDLLDWVGLTDVATETVWLTVKGDPAPFLPWTAGEPGVDPVDNCARLQDTTMEARECTDLRDYSCECDPP